jgi:2-C-methyl-D-erythritol 4-phosphate cytidylyltransferase
LPKISAILAAAGNSSRFQHATEKKTFVDLNGKAVWLHSAEAFFQHPDVTQIIVAISPNDDEVFRRRFARDIERLNVQIVFGGDQRSDSVANALAVVDANADLVAIHDAARPCINFELIQSVCDAAVGHGAAIPAVPVSSTVKRSANGQTIDRTESRDQLYLAQTPQMFARSIILRAIESRGDFQPTDEAQLLERQGVSVGLVAGSNFNIKITHPADLRFAQLVLNSLPATKFDDLPGELR